MDNTQEGGQRFKSAIDALVSARVGTDPKFKLPWDNLVSFEKDVQGSGKENLLISLNNALSQLSLVEFSNKKEIIDAITKIRDELSREQQYNGELRMNLDKAMNQIRRELYQQLVALQKPIDDSLNEVRSLCKESLPNQGSACEPTMPVPSRPRTSAGSGRMVSFDESEFGVGLEFDEVATPTEGISDSFV